METLVSLNCSAESVEKALTLFYYSIKTNYNFYSKYKVLIYYGNDLPKKKLTPLSIGSVEFYKHIFEEIPNPISIDDNYLIKNKNKYATILLENNYISIKSYRKYIDNNDLYLKMIYKVPFRILEKDIINKFVSFFEKKYNVKFIDLYLEKDYQKIVNVINSKNSVYTIYGLNYDGNIGKYKIYYKNDNQFFHLISSLKHNIVMSGNTAVLIDSIYSRLKNPELIIGYRKQEKFQRKGQIVALNKMLLKYSYIEEPKNSNYNKLYDEFINCKKNELNYLVLKKAFIKMLIDENLYKILNDI